MVDADHSAPQPQRKPWAAPRLETWGTRQNIRGNSDQGPDSYGLPCGSPCSIPNTICPGTPGYSGS